jgi:hypothetical protein
MKTLMLVAAVMVGALSSCGPTVCAGTSCICPQGQSCSFDACSASTPGCNFQCGVNSTCSGSCGSGCSVQCDGKTCSHTVGAGSSVACSSGTCTITCEGSCNVAGSGTVNLTCKGTKTAAGCT